MIDPTKIITALCPYARSFINIGQTTQADRFCKGPDCALWRWESITTSHPLWRDAVRTKAEELGEKAPFPKAAAWVAENKVALGIVPTKGFCGAGGAP